MRFFNRAQELARLEELYRLSASNAQLVYISGRRRIGKTALLGQFINAKPALYLFVARQTEQEFLDQLAKALAGTFELPQGVSFTSLDSAFSFLFERATKSQTILVFDEFQNGKYVSPAFFSLFQKQWDRCKDTAQGMIICCGSLQSLMLSIFEGDKEPLYKRATARFLIDEFTVRDTYRMCQKALGVESAETFFDLYSVFGGIPFYYYLMDSLNADTRQPLQTVSQLALRKDSILYGEGTELTVEAQGKSAAIYFSILSAIADGCSKVSEIGNRTGLVPGTLEKYLRDLTDHYRFVRKSVPITDQTGRSKTTRYAIVDTFLRFWFRYVWPNRAMLEIGFENKALELIKKSFTTFQGPVFERMVHNLVCEMAVAGAFPYDFDLAGRYFDQKGTREIDILMLNRAQKDMALCECKLNLNSCNIPSLVSSLQEKTPKHLSYTCSRIFLFSVKPLTRATRDYLSRYPMVQVFTLAEMLE